ncbi:shikimate dehydrogenase family protein [Owenweeksia hongkongensis]|uniref:shikimate dehydrogenase family protein n=1 Tax=Owenweeksia hongkongensis TaxID=253245 RepID=UPI003A8D7675
MQLGLLGEKLDYSFSETYFKEKFAELNLANHSYQNFEIPSIEDFPALLKKNPQLHGLNVTIPYKEEVLHYLDEISPEAEKIGAVNTILIKNRKLIGYNTDTYGFEHSLVPMLNSSHTKALILGTGGASKAISYTLNKLGIENIKVSRSPSKNQCSYKQAATLLKTHLLVVNSTPLGTYPNTEEIPPLALDKVSENHLFYDLIYNPMKSALLVAAEGHGAQIKNGHEMLILQAEKAWQIWND